MPATGTSASIMPIDRLPIRSTAYPTAINATHPINTP